MAYLDSGKSTMFFYGNEKVRGDYNNYIVDDTEIKELPIIQVRDPFLHITFEKGNFTTYKIIIETEHHAFHLRHSCIRRRYTELRWLNDTLGSHHKRVKLPSVPSKKILSGRFERSFVNARMKEIEAYLNELLQIDAVLSDSALHLFLQTDLTIEEMEGYLKGELPEEIITETWASHGHRHTANELGTFHSSATPKTIEMDEEDQMLSSSPRRNHPSLLDVAPNGASKSQLPECHHQHDKKNGNGLHIQEGNNGEGDNDSGNGTSRSDLSR